MIEDESFGAIVFSVLLVCLVLFIVFMTIKEQKEVDHCFLQEPKTKECELVLYKYEHHSRNRTTIVQVPVVVRR